MAHTRATSVHLSSDVAAMLTQAARGVDPATAQTLPDFCGGVLSTLAARLASYNAHWQRLVEPDCDVPHNLAAAVDELEGLIGLGYDLANYVDVDYLRLQDVIGRLDALSQLEESRAQKVPVIWTPDQLMAGSRE